MYKHINNSYNNIHNTSSMLNMYNELPLHVKLLHANYAVLTDEFSMQTTIVGAVSATIYDDILDYDLDDVVKMYTANKLLLDAIITLTQNEEFSNFTQHAIYSKLLELTQDDKSCKYNLNNAMESVKEYT